jgi:hypothetical protein
MQIYYFSGIKEQMFHAVKIFSRGKIQILIQTIWKVESDTELNKSRPDPDPSGFLLFKSGE